MKKQHGKKHIPLLVFSLSVLLAGAFAVPARAEGTEYTDMFRNAFRTQTMPEYHLSPVVDPVPAPPRAPYDSVTQSSLQGRWVNRYKEDGGQVDVEEVLTINGDMGRIECRKNGVPHTVWNGTGGLYLEDRKDQGVCPALTLEEYHAEGNFWTQQCGIYVRWVRGDQFYDGGSLCKWYREEPKNVWDQYLYDTVTAENLQGVWYSEYMDSAGIYQDILNVEGDRASLFETVDGRISETWNGEGPFTIVMAENSAKRHIPELILRKETGPAAGGTAGIYISRVDENRFYDAGLNRWFMRVTEDSALEDQGGSEGNLLFTVYGGSAVRTETGVVFSPAEDESRALILDADTVLVHPETLDGYKEGYTVLQWADAMLGREDGTGLAGVYDADVTGNHIDRIYGLYWWD